jgi:hypothetical protein
MTRVSLTNDAMNSIKRGSNVPVTGTPIQFWLLNIVVSRRVMSLVTSIPTVWGRLVCSPSLIGRGGWGWEVNS